MGVVTWYFDFISPYAYFGLHTLRRLPADVQLRYRPVLFAGLLKHWGQKGPAEIPPKRLWTYRSCLWWARQNDVPFQLPAAHPFNSLPYLRLCIATGNAKSSVEQIFAALWTTGCDPADPHVLATLRESLGVSAERMSRSDVKDSLRASTDDAIRAGIFGVPSLLIGDEVFWGGDAVDFAAAYLADPTVLQSDEIRRADTLPIGASRSVLT